MLRSVSVTKGSRRGLDIITIISLSLVLRSLVLRLLMISPLREFFRETERFPDPPNNPLFLGHIAEFGWVLNETVLNQHKGTGLYLPTQAWKRRGEIAVAIVMTYMNIIYNYHDDFRHSDPWKVLLRSSHITAVTQFWRYRPFCDIELTQSVRFGDTLHDRAAHLHEDRDALATSIGLVGQELEQGESDAMIRFSGYAQGALNEFFL